MSRAVDVVLSKLKFILHVVLAGSIISFNFLRLVLEATWYFSWFDFQLLIFRFHVNLFKNGGSLQKNSLKFPQKLIKATVAITVINQKVLIVPSIPHNASN